MNTILRGIILSIFIILTSLSGCLQDEPLEDDSGLIGEGSEPVQIQLEDTLDAEPEQDSGNSTETESEQETGNNSESEPEQDSGNSTETEPEQGTDDEPEPVDGCTDKNANNYDSNATQDDGSCEYTDTDGDGIRDEEDPCPNDSDHSDEDEDGIEDCAQNDY